MSLLAPVPGGKHENDKESHSNGGITSSNAEEVHKSHELSHEGYAPSDYLHPPFRGPIRPLSPDTISNLSIEEYGIPAQQPYPEGDILPPNNLRGKLAISWKRNKGLFYMLLAQIFGTLMNVATRLLEVEGNHGKGMHPFQILFARMGITAILASLYMWWTRVPDFPFGKPEVRWLLVARGFGGFFGVFGMYYSLLYLPLADATVITFLAPSLACWACSILLKEAFTRTEQVGGLVSLVGVVLIARPTALFSFGDGGDASQVGGSDDMAPVGNSTVPGDAANYDQVTAEERLAAVGMALLGVLGAAVAYTTIRWIGKRTYPLISVNYFATWCTFVSFVAQLVLPGVGFLLPSTLKDWAYLNFLGICGFIMQYLLVLGLSYEKSSRGTNMMYTQMLFALTFDKLVFGHTPGWISIVGSSLILGSAIFIAIQKDSGPVQPIKESSTRMIDEESNRGLMSDNGNDEHELTTNDHDQMPVEEVQLRALR